MQTTHRPGRRQEGTERGLVWDTRRKDFTEGKGAEKERNERWGKASWGVGRRGSGVRESREGEKEERASGKRKGRHRAGGGGGGKEGGGLLGVGGGPVGRAGSGAGRREALSAQGGERNAAARGLATSAPGGGGRGSPGRGRGTARPSRGARGVAGTEQAGGRQGPGGRNQGRGGVELGQPTHNSHAWRRELGATAEQRWEGPGPGRREKVPAGVDSPGGLS